MLKIDYRRARVDAENGGDLDHGGPCGFHEE